jgi:Na+-driven multidrug efflux pump
LPLVKKILITGTPLLLNETVWAAGQAMLLQCYSYRGIAVVSAMNISNTVSNTFSVLFLSVGTAISILLGHRLGAGQKTEAQEDSHRMIAFSLCMGMCAMLLIGATAFFFPQIYNTTDEVRSLATGFTLILAVSAPIHAITNASYFTLRSGGKTKLTFLFDSVYVWCVNIPLALILSRFTGFSPLVVYAICQWIDIAKSAAGIVLVNKGIWVQDITT